MTHGKNYIRAFLFLLAVAVVSGCDMIKDTPFTPTEAEKKLVTFCLKEGDLPVVTRMTGNTLWVFASFEEPLFELRPSPEHGKTEKQPAPFSLIYLSGAFDDEKNFAFSYDIIPDVLPPDPVTYGNGYNEKIIKKRQLIYQALQESFFNVKKGQGPLFAVVIVADTSSGIGLKATLYIDDLKASITEAIPPDEYYLREINEIFGDEALKGDKRGLSLKYAPIEWSRFLTEQMKNRIRSKFSQSKLPKDMDPQKIMAGVAANTLRFYPFTDYAGIYLYDVRGKKEKIFNKAALKAFEEKSWWEEHKGNLTTIHFDGGQIVGQTPPRASRGAAGH